MSRTPKELLADAAARRSGDHLEMTVRELLAHWGCRYRDFDTVARIQADLKEVELTTEPPFDSGPASATVRLVPVGAVTVEPPDGAGSGAPDVGPALPTAPPATPAEGAAGDTAEDVTGEEPADDDAEEAFPQVSLRVGDLPSATGGVVSVSPDDSLATAQTLMMRHGYSQLPVLADPRTLRGAVSWESIASARVGNRVVTLADVINPHPEVVYSGKELLDVLPGIRAAGFAFVRGMDDRICGIVTTADLSGQFERLAGPFFLIGEIERRLRRCISECFSLDDLRAACHGKVRGVEEFVFVHYVRLLENEQRWKKLGWNIERTIFVGDLDEVRKIRNAVMHFKAEPLTDGQLEHLHRFRDWLRQLDPQP